MTACLNQSQLPSQHDHNSCFELPSDSQPKSDRSLPLLCQKLLNFLRFERESIDIYITAIKAIVEKLSGHHNVLPSHTDEQITQSRRISSFSIQFNSLCLFSQQLIGTNETNYLQRSLHSIEREHSRELVKDYVNPMMRLK